MWGLELDLKNSQVKWIRYVVVGITAGDKFAENICKCIFLKENHCISISVKFVPEGSH